VGVNDPFFFFLAECDSLPPNLGYLVVPVVLYAEDLRVARSPYVLLYRSVGGSRQSGASANGADHVDLSIRVRDWCLRRSGNILIQLSFPNQAFDDFPQTYAVFGVMAVMLVVSAEFAGIPIVLPIRLSVIWLRYYLVLVHQDGLIGGV
ncbi:unnamed protein product, partial [Prunus brigantina]